MTRIFIEDFELDIDKELVNRVTYAIDDLEKLDTKATSFTKTIVLPGTTNNNNLLGNIFEFNNSNFTSDSLPNAKYNFNASKSAKCRIEVNGLQIIKGVFRLLEIIYNGSQVEYECSVFGELGGFISKVGNLRLEDLDFSAYDQSWTNANIVASWVNANTGSDVYYPLVDIGQVSTGAYGTAKKDYQYRAFRPALHVREYIDKIITNAGYTWESDFFNTDFFKRLIIPHNSKAMTIISTVALDISYSGAGQELTTPDQYYELLHPTHTVLGSFTTLDDRTYTYGGATRVDGTLTMRIVGSYYYYQNNPAQFNLSFTLYDSFAPGMYEQHFLLNTDGVVTDFDVTLSFAASFVAGSVVRATLNAADGTESYDIDVTFTHITFVTGAANPVQLNLGEAIKINDTIPRGIYQKDFFASLLKMFYLLVTEDKFKDRHLIITPWINFYDPTAANFIDWSMLLDRDKQIRVKPMSEVNARFYELKYKGDTDFYSDAYKKKYNEGYGDRFYDNGLEFSKEKETVEVVFANAVLVGYAGEDKVVPTIFKQSNGVEERIDHVIRIMQAKKVTGVTSWNILNGVTVLSSHATSSA